MNSEVIQPEPGLMGRMQGGCGRVMVVLLTDGRANVGLARSNDDPDAYGPTAVRPSAVRIHLLNPKSGQHHFDSCETNVLRLDCMSANGIIG